MAAQTPQRQPREALQASVEKASPGASSSGDEAVVLLPRGIADLPEELRSKFAEKARWIAQAHRPRDEPPPAPPALPTTARGGSRAPTPAPTAAPAPSPALAEEAETVEAGPSSGELLRRRRPVAGAPPAEAPARKAARRSPPESEPRLPALPMRESPPRRAAAAAAAAEAAEPKASASELEKAKKAAEKSSAACGELRKERDRLLKENHSLKRRLQGLEAASSRRALAASSKAAASAGAKRRPVLSLKTAPREVKIRIKALKTEAKHLRKYGVTIALQQPQGMATWTAAVQGARKELGVKGFKAAKKGSNLYRKAKEIAEKLAKRRQAQAKKAARV